MNTPRRPFRSRLGSLPGRIFRLGARREADSATIFEAAGIGTWEWDVASGRVRWSENMEALHGMAPGSFDGRFESFLTRVYPEDRERVQRALELALGEDAPYHVEYREQTADGRVLWIEGRGRALRDAAGEAVRLIGTCTEITERKRTEVQLQLLAESSTVLAQSRTCEGTLATIAEIVVPGWADWCAIDLLDERGHIESATITHADPAKVEWVRALRRRYPPRLDDTTGAGHVMRTGEAQCVPDVPEELLQHVARDEEHLRTIRALGIRSGVAVPLKARGRILGALTLVSAETPYRFTEKDLPYVQELATHCAMAVDNAQLLERMQSELAERRQAELALQRLNETLEQRVTERTLELEQRARQLQRTTLEAAKAEQRVRRKLAQVLHDDHQQLLVAIKLQLEMIAHSSVDVLPAGLAQSLSRAVELMEGAIENSRSLSAELSPQVLHAEGLCAALHWLAPRKEDKYGLRLHVRTDPAAEPLDENVRVELFELVRELLLNVVKHSGTDEAWVSLVPVGHDELELAVEDRGCGFDVAKVTADSAGYSGFGLTGMRERFAGLGGQLELDSRPGDGTRVRLRLPRQSSPGRPRLVHDKAAGE